MSKVPQSWVFKDLVSQCVKYSKKCLVGYLQRTQQQEIIQWLLHNTIYLVSHAL
jgi:hypothetical protein